MADVAHSTTTITGGHANVVAAGAAGFMTGADKTKLDGIAAGAQVVSEANVRTAAAAFTATLAVNGQRVSSVGAATVATDAPTHAQLRMLGFDIATRVALPANTYSNGAAGVGATITFTGVAPLGVVNGYTPVVGDRILVLTATNMPEMGLYDFTQDGDSGSNHVILTRSTYADTPAKLGQLSLMASMKGASGAGAVFELALRASDITIGTTALFFTRVSEGRGAAARAIDISEDFFGVINMTANALFGGRGGMNASMSGTGAIITHDAGANNTDTELGIALMATGTTATGVAGANCFGATFKFGTNWSCYFAAKYNIPVASTGAQQSRAIDGIVSSVAAAPASGVWSQADAQVNANYQLIVKSATAGGTTTITGNVAISGGTTYDIVEWWKDAGTNQIHWQVNGIPQSDPATTNVPTADLCAPAGYFISVAGTTSKIKKQDYIVCKADPPLGRGAA